MHPDLDPKNISGLPVHQHSLARKALEGYQVGLRYCVRTARNRPDWGLYVLPVFYAHLDISKIPSSPVTRGAKFPDEVSSARIALEGVQMVLEYHDALSSDVCLELWHRVFPWIEFNERQWHNFLWAWPGESKSGMYGIFLVLVCKLFRHVPIDQPAPGGRAFITRIWIHAKRNPSFWMDHLRTMANLLILMGPFERFNIDEMVLAAGGTFDSLAGHIMSHIHIAIQSRPFIGGPCHQVAVNMQFASLAMSEVPQLRDALLSLGYIDLVAHVANLFNSYSSDSPDLDIYDQCYKVCAKNLNACTGTSLIIQALKGGLLTAILTSPVKASGSQWSIDLLTKILPGYLVYCSVLAAIEPDAAKLHQLGRDPRLSESPVGVAWGSFYGLMEKRLKEKRVHDAEGVSFKSCSNIECLRIDRKKTFKCCTPCECAYYCSFECQKTDWRGGHREICQALSIADLRSRYTERIKRLASTGFEYSTLCTTLDYRAGVVTCSVLATESNDVSEALSLHDPTPFQRVQWSHLRERVLQGQGKVAIDVAIVPYGNRSMTVIFPVYSGNTLISTILANFGGRKTEMTNSESIVFQSISELPTLLKRILGDTWVRTDDDIIAVCNQVGGGGLDSPAISFAIRTSFGKSTRGGSFSRILAVPQERLHIFLSFNGIKCLSTMSGGSPTQKALGTFTLFHIDNPHLQPAMGSTSKAQQRVPKSKRNTGVRKGRKTAESEPTAATQSSRGRPKPKPIAKKPSVSKSDTDAAELLMGLGAARPLNRVWDAVMGVSPEESAALDEDEYQPNDDGPNSEGDDGKNTDGDSDSDDGEDFAITYEVPYKNATRELRLQSSTSFSAFLTSVSRKMEVSVTHLSEIGYIPSYKPKTAKTRPKLLESAEDYEAMMEDIGAFRTTCLNSKAGKVKPFSIILEDTSGSVDDSKGSKVGLLRLKSSKKKDPKPAAPLDAGEQQEHKLMLDIEKRHACQDHTGKACYVTSSGEHYQFTNNDLVIWATLMRHNLATLDKVPDQLKIEDKIDGQRKAKKGLHSANNGFGFNGANNSFTFMNGGWPPMQPWMMPLWMMGPPPTSAAPAANPPALAETPSPPRKHKYPAINDWLQALDSDENRAEDSPDFYQGFGGALIDNGIVQLDDLCEVESVEKLQVLGGMNYGTAKRVMKYAQEDKQKVKKPHVE
ncbi:hypothetical protein C8R43DRAFT_956508 [Mycena crocata]|nr:hypothetical protein C8R43DRAFT_956508 [Mycena crocata]